MLKKDFGEKFDFKYVYIFSRPIPILYFLLIVVFILIVLGIGKYVNRNNWNMLVHDQYGFSIEHPANWNGRKFGEIGFKGSSGDGKMIIENHLLFFPPSRSIEIYWEKMNDPSLDDVALWGLEKIKIERWNATETKEVEVGAERYSALMKYFEHTDKQNNPEKVLIHYYLVDEQNALILEFFAENYDTETRGLFDHMLSSFQMID